MREISQPGKLTLANNFKPRIRKNISPTQLVAKSTFTSPFPPLQIVRKANESIPERGRNIFVNHRHAVGSQDALYFDEK